MSKKIQNVVVLNPARFLQYLVVLPLFFFSSLNASQLQEDKEDRKEDNNNDLNEIGDKKDPHRVGQSHLSSKKKPSPINRKTIQDKDHGQLNKLFEQGVVDSNLPTQSIGFSLPLSHAIQQGHAKTTQPPLEQAGINLNTEYGGSRNVLLFAALHGRASMLDYLFNQYQDPA